MMMFTTSLPPDSDIYAVITAAGGNPWINLYDAAAGLWHVDASSQAALDAAAKDYLANTYQSERLGRLKAEKLAALAARRYAVETGGMTLPDGTKVATDRESQALITGAYSGVAAGAVTGNVIFKALSGWATMNPAQLKALFAMVTQHVQACFNREGVLAAQINAATDQAALDAVDITSGWPA